MFLDVATRSEEEDCNVKMHAQLITSGRNMACSTGTRLDKWQQISSSNSTKEGTETLALTMEVTRNETLTPMKISVFDLCRRRGNH
ncbi:unnamed protein product [Calypogeia fissa]